MIDIFWGPNGQSVVRSWNSSNVSTVASNGNPFTSSTTANNRTVGAGGSVPTTRNGFAFDTNGDGNIDNGESFLLGTSVSGSTVNVYIDGRSSTVSTTGGDNDYTRITVNGTSVSGGGATVAAGTTTLFDAASVTTTRSVSASFGTSGAKSGTVALSVTGEGLSGDLGSLSWNLSQVVSEQTGSGSATLAAGRSLADFNGVNLLPAGTVATLVAGETVAATTASMATPFLGSWADYVAAGAGHRGEPSGSAVTNATPAPSVSRARSARGRPGVPGMPRARPRPTGSPQT